MNILLTGATGYIGRRLMQRLLEDSTVRLRLLVRNVRKMGTTPPGAEVVEGDTFNKEALKKALHGVDVAYYLVHSMGAGGHFDELDRVSAGNFRDACIEAGVKRMIYLGGLGTRETASRHLLSRIETGETLSSRPDSIQTIWLRAGIIIGSGSASFEILRNLVQKLPLMVTPRWVKTRTQPVAVRNVLEYLDQARSLDVEGDLIVDIGAEAMSFREMMQRTAKVMGLRRAMIAVPVLSPKLSSYWLVLFTPVPFSVASALIEGLKSETVLLNDHAARFFPGITPISFEEAVQRAIAAIEKSQLISRWCDSSAGEVCDISPVEEIADALYHFERTYRFSGIPAEKVFRSVMSIGGKTGWFTYDLLWRIRGIIDKLLGGYGISRGRRDDTELRVGDKLDFWTVVDVRKDRRLLLEAQMKLPGKAWLEFRLEGDRLIQTAYYYPKGLLGRLYWYLTWPFHLVVFPDLVKNIIRRAGSL